VQYNIQLPSSERSYGLTKGHAVAFAQDAAVARTGRTVPDLAFAADSIAVTFLGPKLKNGGDSRTPVLERACGLGGELHIAANDYFMWARYLRDCNPRDAWRLADIEDTPEMRNRISVDELAYTHVLLR